MFARTITSFCKHTQAGPLSAFCRAPRMPKPPVIPQQRNAYIYIERPPSAGPRWGRQYQHFPGRKRPPLKYLWKNPRFRRFVTITALTGAAFVAYNIEEVPVSHRRRFNCISPETEAKLAKQMYDITMHQFAGSILPQYHPVTRRVKKVLDRLVPVAGMENLHWEVHVIKEDSIKNAFVIPGGKVFVFSGILPICGDDDGLAAVLSHEIAHTIAHHAAERFSKSILVLAALVFAGITLGDPDTVGRMGRIVLDLVYLRPGSRKQEAEADYIGLLMMAQACYDPEKAIALWERMEAAEYLQVPQFLSTHPSHKQRIENIKQWLPEARTKMQMSNCHDTLEYLEPFKKYSVW
ncbi:peptidase family M48-domain-containing protein [Sphaerosporella brunnea]|uniref:Peptidase family M48-domain-containing protein n=1 Tax=Sphaerosporella brunnea TaxID=1250544 RepID=A0A5J5EXQ5_9PEZI|nr:peptidase family M48-domain-containing protein [Sphaerosporella brunnea]